VSIDRLLYPSCCFLNLNTAIKRQLIRTARTLEAECWQVCGEAWVRRQTKISQVPGAYGLLDFTMIRAVLVWRAFWNLWTVYFFNFPIFFFGPRKTADNWNRGYWILGYGGPPVYGTAHYCTILIPQYCIFYVYRPFIYFNTVNSPVRAV
jgi:hypothetical protein